MCNHFMVYLPIAASIQETSISWQKLIHALNTEVNHNTNKRKPHILNLLYLAGVPSDQQLPPEQKENSWMNLSLFDPQGPLLLVLKC